MKELIHVQQKLKVGKDRTQQNYKYRSIDDILEAVKKVMPEGCYITMSDSVENIGNRNYVCATATFHSEDSQISGKAYAWEPEKLAAMSMPQITGSCSSYARKGALCGLLMIDDSKDVDSLTDLEKGSAQVTMATPQQIEALKGMSVEMETTNPKGASFIDNAIKQGLTQTEAKKLIDRGNK